MADSANISERPVNEPMVIDENGRFAVRMFGISADNRLVAESRLRFEQGVFVGAIYRDYDGNQPDPTMRCKRIEISPDGIEIINDDESYYIGRAIYEPVTLSDAPLSVVGSRIELVPDGNAIYWVERSATQKKVDTDALGNRNLNTAGVPFLDAFVVPEHEEVLVFQWVDSATELLDAIVRTRQYVDHCNEGTWQGANPREFLITHFEPTPLEQECYTSSGGLVKFTCKMALSKTRAIHGIDIPGWDDARLSMGRLQVNPAYNPADDESEPLVPIMSGDPDDPDRRQVSEPVLLDANGFQLKDVSLPPVVLSFQNIPTANFDDIGIRV